MQPRNFTDRPRARSADLRPGTPEERRLADAITDLAVARGFGFGRIRHFPGTTRCWFTSLRGTVFPPRKPTASVLDALVTLRTAISRTRPGA